MLWACAFLPSLSLDIFARALSPDDAMKPFAVTTGGRTPRIVSANERALDAGIRSGQLVSASLALEPDLTLRERDPSAETAALEAVATWTTQLTPNIALASPEAVLAEIGGSLRLFGGFKNLATLLSVGASGLGYNARFAFAPTPAAALLFARAGIAFGSPLFADSTSADAMGTTISISGSPNAQSKSETWPDALFPLPLSHSEAEPDAVAMLAAAGITTFGQACELPRAALARRVGAEFVAMLDRVLGCIPDPRPPFVPPPHYMGKINLPAPVESVEALAFAVNRLVVELTGWLTGRGLGIIEMSLTLAHERYVGLKTGIAATEVDFALAAPAREPAHLITVLRERLARVELPAPVETIILTSVSTVRLASRNLGLLPGEDRAATVPLVDRLHARLGEEAVTLVALNAEHRPEHAWRDTPMIAASKPGALVKAAERSQHASETNRRSASHAASPSELPTGPRPVWLLAEPEPLGQQFEAQPWVLRDGPDRIESGWWDGIDVRRDYFVAENPLGETVWIYRDHRYGTDDGEWFMHGLFA